MLNHRSGTKISWVTHAAHSNSPPTPAPPPASVLWTPDEGLGAPTRACEEWGYVAFVMGEGVAEGGEVFNNYGPKSNEVRGLWVYTSNIIIILFLIVIIIIIIIIIIISSSSSSKALAALSHHTSL